MGSTSSPVAVAATDAGADQVRQAQDTTTRTIDRWHVFFEEQGSKGVALWGAGAKGVTFLNAMRNHEIAVAVDVNPRRRAGSCPGPDTPS